VKIFGADGYIVNTVLYDSRQQKVAYLRQMARPNASSRIQGICVIPPQDPNNKTITTICLDWALSKTMTFSFVVYIALIQALCMNDTRFASCDARIRPRIAFRNSFLRGIVPPCLYSLLVWFFALYCDKLVHVCLIIIFIVASMLLLMASAALLLYIKYKIQSFLKKANVRRKGGRVDRTRGHVIIVVIVTFCFHLPYCIYYFNGNEWMWLISRSLFCAYGSLYFMILFIHDNLFRKLFRERLSGVPVLNRWAPKRRRDGSARSGKKGAIRILLKNTNVIAEATTSTFYR